MNTSLIGSEPTPLVVPVTRYVAQFYLPALREEVEAAAPMLVLHAQRIGTEVLLAEQEGLRFAHAVKRGDFPEVSPPARRRRPPNEHVAGRADRGLRAAGPHR